MDFRPKLADHIRPMSPSLFAERRTAPEQADTVTPLAHTEPSAD
jgi:hypothetical protein